MFLGCYWWRPLEAKDLIHWLPGDIITREPAFAIKRASVFMFAPIRIFCWMSIECGRQKIILPKNLLIKISENIMLNKVYHMIRVTIGNSLQTKSPQYGIIGCEKRSRRRRPGVLFSFVLANK